MFAATLKNFNPVRYLREVRDELQKVTWPSRKQTLDKTLLVIVVSIFVGAYIGGLDYLFTQLTAWFIK
jgi:preprotein translocase subunit SecE